MNDWPDVANGLFEISGAVFIAFSIVKLYRDKLVRGISWVSVVFFLSWGCWDLFYYLHINQLISWIGGLGGLVATAVWLGQLIYYQRREGRL